MKNQARYFLLLLAFAINVLALFAGTAGLISTYKDVEGAAFFFGIVLIVAPLLSIVVFADRGWIKSN